ncbi:hypothetical protein FIBSPDRAFT_940727 [Athelia psychrophila]|uniref:F-box domain-containing protein n=1 Tax=Athelia psychrophila TaxID=1759441 RepID=A0A167VG03_9AGAM|nr:hypothetical protein FIBSPDRAFT_940727 [Fibularhizoctonia sp. CBS 109695]
MFSSEDMEQCQSLANALAASVDRWQHFRTNSHPSFLWKIEQAVVQGPTWSRPMLETLEIRSYGRSRQTWPDLGQNDDEAGLTMFAASPKLRYVNLGIGYSFHNDENLPIQLPWQQIEQLDRIDASSEGCMRLLRECPNLVRFNVVVPRHCGVLGPVDFLRHSLQSLEIWFDDESGASFDALFGSVELPSLLELRITFAEDEWQPLAHARLTRFLAATVTLQRLVLKLRHVSPEDFHSILKALPSGLLELEFVHEREESAAPTIYSKQLLEELTLRTRDPPALLPNLRALSLLGALDMNIRAFTAMIRSRTWDNADAHRGAELQSLHIDVLENEDESGRENLMERDPLDLLCSLSPTLLNHPPLVPLPFADRVTLGGAFRVNPGWPRWVDTSLFVVVVFEEVEEVSVYNVTVQGLPGDDDFLNSAAGRCIDSDSEDDDSVGYRSDVGLSGSLRSGSSRETFSGSYLRISRGLGQIFPSRASVGHHAGIPNFGMLLASFLAVPLLRFYFVSAVISIVGGDI